MLSILNRYPCCLTVVIPPPSPNPACSNFLRNVKTWVSTDLGPPLNGGQANLSSSCLLLTIPGGIKRAQSKANSLGLNSTGFSLKVTCLKSRWTSNGPTATFSCRPIRPLFSNVLHLAANSSNPNGFLRTSSAPSSNKLTNGSTPDLAVRTIT